MGRIEHLEGALKDQTAAKLVWQEKHRDAEAEIERLGELLKSVREQLAHADAAYSELQGEARQLDERRMHEVGLTEAKYREQKEEAARLLRQSNRYKVALERVLDEGFGTDR